MYNIERGHHFNEIQKHLVKIKELRGPVYDPVEFRHHYDTIQALGEKLLNLQVRETSYWSSDEFNNKQLINIHLISDVMSDESDFMLYIYLDLVHSLDLKHLFRATDKVR